MTRIKICGLTEPSHALAAAEAGADFVGMVFAESSRRLDVEQARAIVDAVRGLGAGAPSVVGVFANNPLDEVRRTADALKLDYVQLSGEEPMEVLPRIGRPVIRAVHVPMDQPWEVVVPFVRRALAHLLELSALPLLDSRVAGRFGGTGKAFEWEAARALAGEFSFLLAGGLGPDNVAEAVQRVRPWGVDVSSGVETRGRKDPEKIRAFADAVAGAAPTG